MTESEQKSRVLTLVFTDLADSTALKTERGDQAVDALITRHREHVVRLARESSGRVIDWAGDGCFLTFETSSAAVVFALQLQLAHAEEPDLPGVRIGVHLGEVTERPGPSGSTQVKGLAVDIAARISGLANPGQVLMSSSVYNSARQRMGVDTMGQPILWELHGLYDLKGMDHPLEIGEVGLEGMSPLLAPEASDKARPVGSASSGARRLDFILSWVPSRQSMLPVFMAIGLLVLGVAVVYLFMTRLPDAPTPGGDSVADHAAIGPITSLAVLPLSNLMNDPEQDYFVDGMMEAITAELSKISSLKVISRTSAMHYKDTELSMPEIAAELGVMGLIEGSVLRQGNDVRITVQLIEGPADTHLWANSYEGKLEDIFRLHSDVALAIAEEIRAVLSPEERSRIAHAPKVDPEAYELYLRGLETYFDGSVAGSMRAIRYFEDALEIEPDFALAWAHKSMAHISIRVWAPPTFTVQTRLAKQAIDKAIALAPDDARGYIGKVHIELFSLDWYAAKATADRAYELNPNLPEIVMDHGILEACRGDFAEAERYLERAYQLDSRSTFIAPVVGVWLMTVGRRARGIQILERFIADNPDFALAQIFYFFASAGTEYNDEALEALDRFDRLTGARAISNILRAVVLARSGRLEEARALHREALSSGALSAAPPSLVAAYYFSVEDTDRSFDYFEQAMESPDVQFVSIFRMSPFIPGGSFASLHELPKDDRYWELTDRMNYPPFPEGHPGHDRQQSWLARKAAAEEANAPIEKIAVLPFDDIGAPTGEEWFADGMTETLVAQLAKIDGIRVISRTSAMRYRNSDESIPAIARALGVDALVEGSVQRAGNDVRITAQLIHGITDEHLWADSYDGQLDNILSLQADVALAIANEIQIAVAPEDARRLRQQRKIDPRVQEAYLKGRYHMSRRTNEDLERAIDYFQQALREDDDYAAAHAGLARAYFLQSAWDFVAPLENVPLIESEAQRAIELDDTSSDPYVSMATTHLFNQDPIQAEALYLRAIELDPEYPTAHHVYASLLSYLGRYDEAIREITLARELDPVSLIINTNVGSIYMYAREYDQALQNFERTFEMDPNFRPAMFLIPRVLALRGQFEEAIEVSELLLAEHGRTVQNLDQHAMVLAMAGRSEQALAALDEADDIQTAYRPSFNLAAAYAHLREYDEAIRFVEKVINEKQFEALGLRVNPLLDPLRGDPRFQALIDGMNLSPLPPDHPVAIMNRERMQAEAN